ncbi:hypothetical protein [Haloarcula sebkhae]|uniref:Uncharacterized protein n=2 Tax=Haloarcula sebkhae TaxID=932660 RepID=A0ACC6VIG5_9EURY|nr:hypothetical protein [Haloarcula sebkhae]GGK74359.1 hypothetical protein GCM10009067_28200 [Haloarcula sebkhae]
MPDDDGPDGAEVPEQLWESVCHQARLTLDQQVTRIENYDTKAVGIFRANILLTGLLLSGLAIVVRTDGVNPGQFFNLWSLFGAIGLLFSTILSAMAYTSSSYDLGIGPQVISDAERGIYESEVSFQDDLRGLYKQWLQHNANVGKFNSYLITGAIILLMDAIVFFAGTVATGLYNPSDVVSVGLFILAVAIILIANLLVYFAEKIFILIYQENN